MAHLRIVKCYHLPQPRTAPSPHTRTHTPNATLTPLKPPKVLQTLLSGKGSHRFPCTVSPRLQCSAVLRSCAVVNSGQFSCGETAQCIDGRPVGRRCLKAIPLVFLLLFVGDGIGSPVVFFPAG